MKILIVDDSTGMRNLVKRAVVEAKEGTYDFEEAANGVEALKKILSNPPDMVICDWYIPEMSGLALLRAIRANGSEVAFGVITADGSQAVHDTATEAGADFVVRKPFTAVKFKDAIHGESARIQALAES